jgi:hypothetical protein
MTTKEQKPTHASFSEAEDAPAWEATDVSAADAFSVFRVSKSLWIVEIASVQVGNTLFLRPPIVEIAAIDRLHHDLELPAIFARRIQVNAVRQTMTLQFGMPR